MRSRGVGCAVAARRSREKIRAIRGKKILAVLLRIKSRKND